MNSWVQPINETEDFEEIISKTRREIKKYVYQLNNNNYKQQSIVDLDIRTKGIRDDKRSFMNLEITLYVNNQLDVKSKDTKITINKIIEAIIDGSLTHKKLFNFHRTKK